MKTRTIIIIFLILLVLAVLAVLAWLNQEAIVSVEKNHYNNGGSLRLKLRNNSLKEICFSSCYPYYLEIKRAETWQSYSYEKCSFVNLAENCLKPLAVKYFGVDLPEVEEGHHRLAVPVCTGCQEGAGFKETNRFYSGELEIK